MSSTPTPKNWLGDARNSTTSTLVDFVGNVSNVLNESAKSRCAPFPNSPHRCTQLANVRRSVAVLSLTGCLLVLFIIWLLRRYERSPAQRVIFGLTISATFHSIGGCLADPDTHPNSAQCQIQAFMVQFGVWAIMLWIACIAFNVSWTVLGVRRSVTPISHEKANHAICWSLSILMSTIPFAFDAYGHTGGWCWITGKYKELRFAIYYIPLYFILCGILILYVLIARKVRRKARAPLTFNTSGNFGPENPAPSLAQRKRLTNRTVRSLFAYPLLFLAVTAFPLINRIYQAARGEGKAVFALSVMHAVSIQIMGLANALLYSLKKEIFAEIKRKGFVSLFKARIRPYKTSSRDSTNYPTQLKT